jgi:glutamate 5-kinase
MLTKLQAADLARRSGSKVVIASGAEQDVLVRLVDGERIGTHFSSLGTTHESRKRFLLAARKLPGALIVDDGAVQALSRDSSLLPVGVVAVDGAFQRGDIVRVTGPDGRELARGIVNYASADLARIQGRHSDTIEHILGFFYGEEVIHRDNLVLV